MQTSIEVEAKSWGTCMHLSSLIDICSTHEYIITVNECMHDGLKRHGGFWGLGGGVEGG